MTFAMLPLVAFSLGATNPADSDNSDSVPRVAQVKLAETLASADAIESVVASGQGVTRKVTFVIVRGGDALHVVARTRKGEVVSLAVRSVTPIGAELHGLTWLADEMREATAVTQLVVDADGAVTLATSEGRKYMAIPGRGSGGGVNAAAEARWAAEWNADS